MTCRSVAGWAALAVLSIVPGFLTACSNGSAGPLPTVSAGPLQALSAGGQPIVDGGSVEIHPGGSADFTAFVVNPLKSPVTLMSASVVPVTGSAPTGQLLHVGISTTTGMAGAADGWPVAHLPTRSLTGARIGHGQADIIFGISGGASGREYFAAGLRIRYRYHGQVYYVTAWSAAVACVVSVITRHPACPDASEHTQAEVKQMAAK